MTARSHHQTPARPLGSRVLVWHALGFLARLLRGLLAAIVLVALLAGLPWALTRFVGWPLPDHLPSWAEIHSVLSGPMATTFLLDFLACASWLVWALFVFDAARCAIKIARDTRMPNLSTAGPVRRIATTLAGAILISLLGNRVGMAATRPVASLHTGFAVVASAVIEQRAPVTSVVVLPPDPETGAHDSLWRIAARTLGDGNRWPEIFELNKGKPQPGGGTFTQPSLVFPGEEFMLPADATALPQQPIPQPPPPLETPPPTTVTPAPNSTTTPAPPIPRTQEPSADSSGAPGFRWGEKLFVGLGLASAVSAALVVARHRHRRRYRPGSGDRTDLPVAPVVYQLRLAHLRAAQNDNLDLPRPEERPQHSPASPVGVRDGKEIALDLAAAHGLGYVGAGAVPAACALLVTALTAATQVVIPADDLAALIGRRTVQTRLPAGLQVTADLDAALDWLEAETLVRADRKRQTPDDAQRLVMLVARTPERQRQRLQAVLDNGSSFGVTAVLLGQWTPGVTAYVRDDGTISTTNPGLGESLRGTAVFRLDGHDTAGLLALLHGANPQEPEEDYVARPVRDADLELLTAPTNTQAHAHFVEPHDSPDDHGSELVSTGTHASLRISVLGPPRMWWCPKPGTPDEQDTEREITSAFQPRARELLVFLALHPDGASREALTGALWPTSPPEKTTNALNTSLSRLRRSLAAATGNALSDVVLAKEGRYHVDLDLVEVDYHRFAAAVTARRAARTEQHRIEANQQIVDSYTGPLADGLSTEWIETARESIRRDAIDAVAALARALVDHDPQQTLDLLEVARAFDPHNELIYRDIMRLQQRLGQLDAIPRTLALLRTRLAEVDDRPTSHAVSLAEQLSHHHDTNSHPQLPLRTDRERSRAG